MLLNRKWYKQNVDNQNKKQMTWMIRLDLLPKEFQEVELRLERIKK